MRRSTILFMRGIVAVLAAVAAFAWPGLTPLVLLGIFTAYALLDGITSLWLGLTSTPTEQRMWAPVVRGLAGIVTGIFTFLWPVMVPTLVVIAALWAVAIGVLDVFASVELRRVIPDEALLRLSGLVSMIFGVWLFALRGHGPIGIGWALAAYAMVNGVVLLTLALRLRMRIAV